jgi:anhydro-N-acetylmuramic acid kinase
MLVAGLMSGTSADGVDVALVNVTGRAWKTRFELVAFHSVPYPPAVRQHILRIAGGSAVSASEISQLNFLLGELFARACLATCRRTRLPLRRLELIGSHGQTIYHQGRAEKCCGFPTRSTLQIGEAAVIAERTGITTIADFRPSDMAAGGQGAPLVPFFDYLLFRHPRKGRIALNIGEIANVTAIPAAAAPEEVLAFDTGPGNMLLDALAVRAGRGRLRCDRDGKLAASGEISEPLLRRLLRQSYFRLPPPKTAGREQFGSAYLEQHLLPEHGSSARGLRNALATATALTAESITQAIVELLLPKFPIQECFVSGGGVKNRFLMQQLRMRLQARSAMRVLPSDSAGIPAEAKEASPSPCWPTTRCSGNHRTFLRPRARAKLPFWER